MPRHHAAAVGNKPLSVIFVMTASIGLLAMVITYGGAVRPCRWRKTVTTSVKDRGSIVARMIIVYRHGILVSAWSVYYWFIEAPRKSPTLKNI